MIVNERRSHTSTTSDWKRKSFKNRHPDHLGFTDSIHLQAFSNWDVKSIFPFREYKQGKENILKFAPGFWMFHILNISSGISNLRSSSDSTLHTLTPFSCAFLISSSKFSMLPCVFGYCKLRAISSSLAYNYR